MFTLAWPLVLGNVAITAMTATDMMILGWRSPESLAAGALGFNVYQPILVAGIGVVGALSPIAASKLGAGEASSGLRSASHQGLLSALVIALAAWLLLSQTKAILLALGEDPDLSREAGVYMLGLQWALLPSLLFFAGRSLFASLNRPRPTLIVGLGAVIFNGFAAYALVFGKFGLPELGVFGSGFATSISATMMFLSLMAVSALDPRMRKLRLFALPWRPARTEWLALWRLGLPIGAALLAEVGVFCAASLAVGLLGQAPLVAHTVVLQIASLSFMVPLGLGQAASVRVGYAYGARDPRGIARAGWSAFGLTVGFAALSSATMILAPRLLITPFLALSAPKTRQPVAIAATLLGVAAMFQIFDASQVALANMLRGLHDSRTPFVIAVFGYWAIGAPVGVALGFWTTLGVLGVWIGLASGLAAVSVLLLLRWIGMERRGFLTPAPGGPAPAVAVQRAAV